jgi:cyclopropane-fatty-acyl-phospholipid synthase
MASQKDIERTYDYMDEALRGSLGEFLDLSCAFYDGDNSLTLEQAQSAKHDYVLKSVQFVPGMRVLDIGCGWGPMLRVIRDRGGYGVGLTLSPRQARACMQNNLEVYLKDWKELTVDDLGRFDAIVSLGAFEHFCAPQEYLEGKQDSIYAHLFSFCCDSLPAGGRLYLQTMAWDKPQPYEAVSLKAPKGSDAHVMALLSKFYPGSWPPYGKQQICQNAQGFRLINWNSGRRDYIQTMMEWRRRRIWRKALHWRQLPHLAIRYATSRDFRYQLASLRHSCNRLCFERHILDHWRLVFEKDQAAWARGGAAVPT